MKIIVPLAGSGRRFRCAGYATAKPLIPVDGEPMVRRVVGLFPGERDFLFIANADQAADPSFLAALEAAAPGSRVAVIPPHREGPVASVCRALDAVPDDGEVIVNYCDFSKAWDYADFLRHTRGRRADGAVCAYKGFHPHMLADPNYAFIRHERQWLVEIREKKPFTDRRMGEYASDGTYYFRTGAMVKKYFPRLMERGVSTEGEYYVSMAYNLMREDGLAVSVYEIGQMLQWGTPRDLEDYQRWSDYFRRVAAPAGGGAAADGGDAARTGGGAAGPGPGGVILMPMAGEGRRFREAGYAVPKPLLEVNGTPMFVQALRSLPGAARTVVAASGRLLDAGAGRALAAERPDARVVRLEAPTAGEAATCREALAGEDPGAPVLIAPCDAAVLWSPGRYARLIDEPSADIVVWTASGHEPAARRPELYGWVEADGTGLVKRVSVKEPLSREPLRDRIILGLFAFRRIRDFLDALASLERKGGAVRGEYFVDSCVGSALAAGLKARVFDVDGFACWGTPEELRTYLYWQRFFHGCPWHPYELAAHRGLERPAELAAALPALRQEFA